MVKDFDDMVIQMLHCEQTKGQSVYQHGQSVREHFHKLSHDIQQNYLEDWKLPKWFPLYATDLLHNAHDKQIIDLYTLFHDCGKPFCRTQDETGVHFPDHAEVSRQVWLSVGGCEVVGKLIGHDMVLHVQSAEEIEGMLKNEWGVEDACSLLLVAFCEIHSNARLFGGIDSSNFKMKGKKLDRRGKQICKHYFGDRT